MVANMERKFIRERLGLSLGPMLSLDLRPILFEYLVRVANGSLPSSFSRQCHQETRRFATLLTQHVLRVGARWHRRWSNEPRSAAGHRERRDPARAH